MVCVFAIKERRLLQIFRIIDMKISVVEIEMNNHQETMEGRTTTRYKICDSKIRTIARAQANNETMKRQKHEKNLNLTFRTNFCLTILILSLLSTSSILFIPKATASNEVEKNSG